MAQMKLAVVGVLMGTLTWEVTRGTAVVDEHAHTRYPQHTAAQPAGRTFIETLWSWITKGDDYDYNYDYDYDYDYYGPWQVVPPRKGHDDGQWFYDFVFGVGPVALLLTALPVGLSTFFVRRSFDGADNLLVDSLDASEAPLLKSLSDSENFVALLLSQQCQQKLFCELAQIGERPDASFMQKAFYYVSTLTPDSLARRVGLARLFRTSRANACQKIPCSTMLHSPHQLLDDEVAQSHAML